MDLYKGIAGSPITYLTADISANQTTITIADDSALPDAPNICTIGYGEHLETIKYETKSNGVLQNVTRGIEGTPRAWPAGTEVARFFTAYDHNAIIENFNSHLADDVTQGNPHGIDAKANRALGTIYSATMTNGWSGSIHYCKNDVGMVAVYTRSALTTGVVSDVVAQLPVGYRPQSKVYALVDKGNIHPYDLAMGLSINSGGQIHIIEPLRSLLTQGRHDGLSFYVVFQVDN